MRRENAPSDAHLGVRGLVLDRIFALSECSYMGRIALGERSYIVTPRQ